MIAHVALFQWRPSTKKETVDEALKQVRSLKDKVNGIVDIMAGENFSKWSEGYTHAVIVIAKDMESLEAYRNHPDHVVTAKIVDRLEEKSVAVDFEY